MNGAYCYKNDYVKKLCTKKNIQEIKYQMKMAQKKKRSRNKWKEAENQNNRELQRS